MLVGAGLAAAVAISANATDSAGARTYENRLTPIAKPRPLLGDTPEFLEPVQDERHFEAPVLVQDDKADLEVRAWRFSYNARGIVEIPNRLEAAKTAVIVVHPWGIDDGQGWKTPQPAGVAFNCTPQKNRVYHRHVEKVLNPFLKRLRGKVGLIAYSLPGTEDPIRKKLYRSVRSRPTAAEREQGAKELAARLKSFRYEGGGGVAEKLTLSRETTVSSYLQQFRGLDAGDRSNGPGFWQLPIPVVNRVQVAPDDVVIYDGEGYGVLRDFLKRQGIRHVLLAGYATDMCVRATCAGYLNLDPDFNVFLVGDATMATFPANSTPRFATNASLSCAALDHLITQVSWIRPLSR